jgi:hypothetical protein
LLVYTVKGRHYGKAADGRTVLLFTPGTVITDDEARAAGLLAGAAAAKPPARGLTIDSGERLPDEAPPARPLARMNLAELRAVCEEESIDIEGLNLRAELIEAIDAARAARDFEAGPTGDD